MKKICFITQCSLPVPTVKGGAVETLVEYIINQNEIEKKYLITVITLYDEKAYEISKKYSYTKFVWIKKKNEIINKYLMLIYKILKHLNIYIPFSLEFSNALNKIKRLEEQDLFIYEGGPTTQISALSKIVSKEKLIVHLHWDGMGNKKKDKGFSYLLPVSDYIGECWHKSSGCAKEKIKPLYNCANLELFNKEISEEEKIHLRQQLDIPSNNKIILFIGRIVEEKGIRELLKAFDLLKHDNVTLLVIGSANFGAKTRTSYEMEIETMIKNTHKSIVFTGFVHQTELYKYYNICNLIVIPSLFQDPAPLVSIEAQAAGVPIIATDVGGIKEYIDKKGVILIKKDHNLIQNLSKEIDTVLNDDIREIQMRQYNKINSEKYGIPTYFENFSEIVNEIMK